MSPAPGARLGPYDVVALVGAGAMGEVYRAREPRLGRDVAIKVLPPAFAGDADRLSRFEQEARAAAALNHPNILAVFDIGRAAGSPYIVSELLEGGTLRECLKANPLPVRKAVEYASQIAHGLAAAHEKGIVHRDLKPDNIFVTTGGRVKILDFGLAKLTEPRLGPYEITGSLGAGGMGEVYRARDTKLGRAVALKILPDAFADDPDRVFSPDSHWLALFIDKTGKRSSQDVADSEVRGHHDRAVVGPRTLRGTGEHRGQALRHTT